MVAGDDRMWGKPKGENSMEEKGSAQNLKGKRVRITIDEIQREGHMSIEGECVLHEGDGRIWVRLKFRCGDTLDEYNRIRSLAGIWGPMRLRFEPTDGSAPTLEGVGVVREAYREAPNHETDMCGDFEPFGVFGFFVALS